jgi:hypothetical protein
LRLAPTLHSEAHVGYKNELGCPTLTRRVRIPPETQSFALNCRDSDWPAFCFYIVMTHWVDRVLPYFATVMNFMWSGTLLMEILSRRETVGSKFCAFIADYLIGAS